MSCLNFFGWIIYRLPWASLVAQLVKNLPVMWETWVRSLGWEDNSGEGKGYPLQYSCLMNSKDWIVHGITELDTTEWLSLSLHASDGKQPACNAGDQVGSLGQENPLEKEMATPSSILAWRNPWTEEPNGLLVHGVAKCLVKTEWLTLLSNLTFIQWLSICLSREIEKTGGKINPSPSTTESLWNRKKKGQIISFLSQPPCHTINK